jgi:hypothetical protein
MPEVVGFIQLACALTLGMAGAGLSTRWAWWWGGVGSDLRHSDLVGQFPFVRCMTTPVTGHRSGATCRARDS